jgi:hypothetical protein
MNWKKWNAALAERYKSRIRLPGALAMFLFSAISFLALVLIVGQSWGFFRQIYPMPYPVMIWLTG